MIFLEYVGSRASLSANITKAAHCAAFLLPAAAVLARAGCKAIKKEAQPLFCKFKPPQTGNAERSEAKSLPLR